MNVMEQGNRFVPYFYKRKNYSTKNVELAVCVWVVWEKCGKELCGETVGNNKMGKVWKNCEKNSVEKIPWKNITYLVVSHPARRRSDSAWICSTRPARL